MPQWYSTETNRQVTLPKRKVQHFHTNGKSDFGPQQRDKAVQFWFISSSIQIL